MMPGLIAIAVVLVFVVAAVVGASCDHGGAAPEASELSGFPPKSHVTVIPLPYDQEKDSDDAQAS